MQPRSFLRITSIHLRILTGEIHRATDGIRTHDLTITNRLLYQLSYGGTRRIIPVPDFKRQGILC